MEQLIIPKERLLELKNEIFQLREKVHYLEEKEAVFMEVDKMYKEELSRRVKLENEYRFISSKLENLNNNIDDAVRDKAKERSKNFLAGYSYEIASVVVKKLSKIRFGFWGTKIKGSDLDEIEGVIRRIINNILYE